MSTQYLDVTGGRIAYELTGPGRGTLAVLVHGTGDTHKTYRFLAPRLAAAGYRVAAMDVRGYGDSSTGWADYTLASVGADVVSLIRHLGGPAVVIGHSVGGASAVWAAAALPGDVRAVVQIGTPSGEGKISPVIGLAARLVTMRAAFWGMYYKTLFVSVKPADLDPYVKDLTGGLRRRGRLAPLRGQVAEMLAGLKIPFGEVSCPSLIIVGSKDKDLPDPESEASAVARRLAGPATVKVIPDVGHYVHAEVPDVAADAILSFLDSVTVPGSTS
jgi:pimeloyl-ACP methyl ester carboxylesterase